MRTVGEFLSVFRKRRPVKGFIDYIMDFEWRVERAIQKFSQSLPANSNVLDAGAGEAHHKKYFSNINYVAADLAVGDMAWNYKKLDVIADISALPFFDESFDAVINIVTMEHVSEPVSVIEELSRVTKPAGMLLLVAPMEWEEHQQPYDFFRYTRYGLAYLLQNAGYDVLSIEPCGGIFRVLSRRCLMALKVVWWLAPLLIPLGILFPLFDRFDRRKNSTLGFICLAQKRLSTIR